VSLQGFAASVECWVAGSSTHWAAATLSAAHAVNLAMERCINDSAECQAEVFSEDVLAWFFVLPANACFGMCSPDLMIREVQSCPSVRTLMDLKDCLDFCSTSWVALYCRLGGAGLLLQASAPADVCHSFS